VPRALISHRGGDAAFLIGVRDSTLSGRLARVGAPPIPASSPREVLESSGSEFWARLQVAKTSVVNWSAAPLKA